MAQYPTVDDVRAWVNVPEAEITDEQIDLLLSAEIDVQAEYCTFIPDWVPADEIPEAMAQALLRRCARAIAARGVPLGSLPVLATGVGANFGLPGTAAQAILPRLDAEVERLEAAYRVVGIA
jgi:hypothetical protein